MRKSFMLLSIVVLPAVAAASSASALTCRPTGGGARFEVDEAREVPAAAVKAAGSEECDVVYHIDGKRYELGGCDRRLVGEWSLKNGDPRGFGHRRLALICK